MPLMLESLVSFQDFVLRRDGHKGVPRGHRNTGCSRKRGKRTRNIFQSSRYVEVFNTIR